MKIQSYIFSIVLFVIANKSFAQFPPPAGQEGSTAIYKDSSAFIDWASGCSVERGFLNVSQPELGLVDFGSEEDALGVADNAVVSLGDGGVATLTFDVPVANGYGFDFAVFENGFSDTFLELAFVEVSSDGENFFRFNSVSLTQTDEQIGSFGELNTEKINNLAGKYRVEYGTPFDLEELTNEPGLDVNHITHIRIIDVTGCIQNDYATFDSQGNKVNDPWPTPFPSGGFDLDAVGVIHNAENLSVYGNELTEIKVFPNPVPAGAGFIQMKIPDMIHTLRYSIISLDGCILSAVNHLGKLGRFIVINIDILRPGVYILKIETSRGVVIKKIVRS